MDKHTLNGWEERYCLDTECREPLWMVKRSPEAPDLWLVARTADDVPWQVAATVPGCPLCGSPLLTRTEIEEGIEPTGAGEEEEMPVEHTRI